MPSARYALCASVGLALGASLLLAVPAHSAPQLDQANESPRTATVSVGTAANQTLGQTFTAGITGRLTSIQVWMQRVGNPSEVTATIFGTTSQLPADPALASVAVASGTVGIFDSWITFSFDNPPEVTQGVMYGFVLTATGATDDDAYNLSLTGNTYAGGTLNQNFPPATVANAAQDIRFRTFVDPATSDQTPVLTLSVSAGDGAVCAVDAISGRGNSWLATPDPADCTPPASKPNARLLGWATTPSFPVAVAQQQINNGWGTFESYNTEGQLVAVFIPAGQATYVSGPNNLYAIWNQ